ncbi:hypothetical protein [Bacillus cereus]|uniref:hypothetical protein n=1 Tax=Bacillus cereus TaxID=1396 RepID=UPI00359C9BCF
MIASAVNGNDFIKQIPKLIIGYERSNKKAIFKLIIKSWAQKIGLAPSQLLIPLTYAASKKNYGYTHLIFGRNPAGVGNYY